MEAGSFQIGKTSMSSSSPPLMGQERAPGFLVQNGNRTIEFHRLFFFFFFFFVMYHHSVYPPYFSSYVCPASKSIECQEPFLHYVLEKKKKRKKEKKRKKKKKEEALPRAFTFSTRFCCPFSSSFFFFLFHFLTQVSFSSHGKCRL